ncbi:MAG TPA: hypothetical protein VHS03_06585 [Gaiellaceae bacterium]|nr:hypothetical protein [Gaiellaceae bacterium]
MRLRLLLMTCLAMLAFGVVAGSAGATGKTEPRCCGNKKPPNTGGPLPLTGLQLYVPTLLSLGLVGAGVTLRLRARES